jgi:hypothetical protein
MLYSEPPINAKQAKCILQPMGAHGLEGYSLDDLYKYEYRETGANDGKPYYRIWPTEGNYYETCSANIFKHYFKPID